MGIVGKYQRVSSENGDKFLKALGLGLNDEIIGEIFSIIFSTVINISHDGQVWTVKRTSSKTETIQFREGESYQGNPFNGTAMPVVTTIQGNKMMTISEPEESTKPVKSVMTFSDDGMVLKIHGETENWVIKYKRIE